VQDNLLAEVWLLRKVLGREVNGALDGQAMMTGKKKLPPREIDLDQGGREKRLRETP
jgi:hypothetical protein